MNKNKKDSIISFFKRYGYIVVLSVIMLVLSTVLLVFANKSGDGGTTPVDTDPVSFYSPLLSYTVAKEYSDTRLMFNSTLKQWESHKGVCFTSPEGSDVYAALDGVVEDVYTSYLNGTVVVISHANNLKTYYSSLGEKVNVKKGETVKKGAAIGKVSSSRNGELNLGNQLYFEVLENNVKVNPALYLNLENK